MGPTSTGREGDGRKGNGREGKRRGRKRGKRDGKDTPVPDWESENVATLIRGGVGVKTLQIQDTSDPRHFGTSAEVSVRHFGTIS